MKWFDLPGWGMRTQVMGILNVTYDSFSGDGLLSKKESQLSIPTLAKSFIESGAAILDIGGQSSRPGGQLISEATETERVIPLVLELKSKFPSMRISVDTYRASVAEAALLAGADIINDIWALQADPDMAPMLAEKNAAVILVHNKSRQDSVVTDRRLGGMYEGAKYQHVVNDVARELSELVNCAVSAGIVHENIVVDPGIGFGKSVNQNLALISHLDILKSQIGLPVLLGTSRKSFIGKVMDEPVQGRLEGTVSTIAVGVMKGADIVRVHDIKSIVKIVQMVDRLKAVSPNGQEGL